jgi:MFS family permease
MKCGGVKELEKNITKIYLLTSFSSFILVSPIIVLFMQSRSLSYKEIMLLQSIFAIAIVALELPTGILADKIGRKNTIVLSMLAFALSHIIFTFAHNFREFLISKILFSLSFALISGSKSAFIYETLKELGKEDSYKEVMGKIGFISYFWTAIGAIIGGLLAKFSLDYAFYANIINLTIAPFIALTLKEPPLKKAEKNGINILKTSFKKIFLNGSNLKFIIFFSATVYAFNQGVYFLYQPYLKQSGIDLVYFGIIFALFQIVAGYSSKNAHKIENKIGLKNSFLLISLLVGISEIAMGFYIGFFGFIIIFAQQFVRGFKDVIISDVINKQISSENRATVLSIESLFQKILISITLLIIGYLADVFSLQTSLILFGSLALISICSVFLILKNKIG